MWKSIYKWSKKLVKITKLLQKYQPEICRTVSKEVQPKLASQKIVQISKVASESISNTQRGVIQSKESVPKLYRYSLSCAYFGADSAEHIQNRIGSQIALSWFKIREQNLENFPPIVLSSKPNIKDITKSIDKLKEKGFGRVTVTDGLFGNGLNEGTHTIGLVSHKGKYIFLDSLPERYPEIKNYHEKLIKYMGLNSKDVIFSNKSQQTLEEYTCNNWTHANLDTVIDYLKNDGKDKELTLEILDKILPDNINNVLNKQRIYTIEKLNGKDLNEIVAEAYTKKYS